MNISKKWGAAAAGALTLALVGSGAVSANAAEGDILDPQSNGSQGSYYLWSNETFERVDVDPDTEFTRASDFFGSGSADAMDVEIPRPAGAEGATGAYTFVASADEIDEEGLKGTNVWRMWNLSGFSETGGISWAPLKLQDFTDANSGGIESVFNQGGEFYLGYAWTINNGVTPVGMVYRTINVDAATDTFTIDPVEVEGPGEGVIVGTHPASQSVVVGENAEFTAAATGSESVKWQSQTVGGEWTDVAGATTETLTVSNVTLAQTGTQYRAVYQPGDVATNAATLTVTTAPIGEDDEPTDADDASTKLVAERIVLEEGVTTVELTNTGVDEGTYRAFAWSVPTQLPNATVDADGDVSINIAGLPAGDHTIALIEQGSNDIVGWLTITIPQPTNESVVDLSANVITSNKFALEGVATAVDLTSNEPEVGGVKGIKRGGTTNAVQLTPFTVTDDRATLPGWNLVAGVDDFKNDGVSNPAALDDTIGKAALGLKPIQVGTAFEGITLGAEQIAGSGNYENTIGAKVGALFAEGAPNSTTGEAGTQFDADLTFKAPLTAKAGTYKSKLTLTLTSK